MTGQIQKRPLLSRQESSNNNTLRIIPPKSSLVARERVAEATAASVVDTD